MPQRARRWFAGNSYVKGYGNGVPPLSPGHEWHLAPSPASTVVACFSRGHKFGLTLARLPDLPSEISLHSQIAARRINAPADQAVRHRTQTDRKSTRLNSSH